MYRLPAFKGAARQRGYGIGGTLKGLTRTFEPDVKRRLTFVIPLNDISRGEDVKVAIKRRAVEEAKRIGKKSINRAPARKTVTCKRTATESRLIAAEKKIASVDLL